MKSGLKAIACIVLPALLLGWGCERAGKDAATQVSGDSASEPEQEQQEWPDEFGLGREATEAEISRVNTDVAPDGTGLPDGSGTAAAGSLLYAAKCAACHGPKGYDGPEMALVTPPADYRDSTGKPARKLKTIGNYWPYATTLYDYIRRAMPFNAPGSLEPGEVYSLTAFLLAKNGVIDGNEVLTARKLPAISMPARKNFVPDDRRGGPEVR
jgi:S-disulfanyl-L-cysteine oxidoreductase SoxD